MATHGLDEESFQLESAVRGHHVFKSVWTPVVGELLQVQAEAGNSHARGAHPAHATYNAKYSEYSELKTHQ